MPNLPRWVVALMLVATTSIDAAIIPGRWDKVDALASGTQISVALKSGERVNGEFRELTTDSISMVVSRGAALSVLQFPRSEISRIVRPKRDNLANGALIGCSLAPLPAYFQWRRIHGGEDMPGTSLVVALTDAGELAAPWRALSQG